MAKLNLKHIYKVYPNGTKAVSDFNMEISDKEFIVFVGPSGCGKSTTLRMIAGLEKITYGELTISDEVVNSLEPKERDIAMVFQNYALYPHMTIYENIAFGLRTRHMAQEEIDKRVKEAAKTLGIEDYLDKKPKEMSGGQRQRVALGRAIVREPKVMLLDEPLSNLDAKLRTQMRSEIVKLHKKLNTTFIYVTHDQVEAMTMGTRIVVMKDGYIKQIDTPKNLYRYPDNKFVASFIGSPQMNFFLVTLNKDGEDVIINFLDIKKNIRIPFENFVKIIPSYLDGTKEVILGIRSENIKLKKSKNSVQMKVSHIEELGNETLIYGDLDLDNESIVDSSTRVIVKAPGFLDVEPNSIIDISFDNSFIHLFDKESEDSILKRVPNNNYVNVEVKEDKLFLYGLEFSLPSAIKVPPSKYEALIPLKSILVKEGNSIKVLEAEAIEKGFLLTLMVNDHIFFAYSEKKYQYVDIDIDMAQITIKTKEKEVVTPLSVTNSFAGEFINKKVKDGFLHYHNEYFIRLLESEFPSLETITKKMCQAYANRELFHKKYLYSFSPDAIKISNEGIKGIVKNRLDYGNNVYVLIKIGDKEIVVKNNEVNNDEEVYLQFDFEKMEVTEIERDIKII